MGISRRSLLGAIAGATVAGCSAPPPPSPAPTGPVTSSPSTSGSPSASPEPVLRIATASDLHFGEPDTDYERYAAELVERLNAVNLKTQLDHVVLNGDLTHAATWLAPLATVLNGLSPGYLTVQGNHDGATVEQWRAQWGHGFNHKVDVKGVRLLAVATSDAAGAYRCANTGYLTEQLDAAGTRPVIVAMHITPATWTKYGIDCADVTDLLGRRSNVVAVLNGHDHDEFGVKTRAGVPYLFDSHAGGHWGTDFRGFRVLELFADGHLNTWVTDGTTTYSSTEIRPRQ